MKKQPIKPVLTYSRLKEVLHYGSVSGQFMWLVRQGNTGGDAIFNGKFAGKIAGGIDRSRDDHWMIRIDGKLYKSQVLAWFLVHGVMHKDNEIVHINNDKSDNRLINLREVATFEEAVRARIEAEKK